MRIFRNFLNLAVGLAICTAHPIEQKPTSKVSKSTILFRIDQPLTLECDIIGLGDQNVTYSWRKNGQPIIQENKKSLIIQNPKAENEGNYQCLAETDFGIASSIMIVKRTYLIVPKVTPLRHQPVEGRGFKLECPIPDAYPKPTISWRKEGVADMMQEIMDRRITIGPDGALYFTNVTKDDIRELKYICFAESPAIDDRVVIAQHYIDNVIEDKQENNGELVPLYLSENVVAKEGENTFLYCIYGGSPFAHPDWFFEGKILNENKPSERITRYNRSAGKRLLIKDTYLSDQGTYKCAVNNGIGKPQEHSISLTVVSAPKYITKPSPQIITKEGQDIVIPCIVQGVKAPQVSWTYNAEPVIASSRLNIESKQSISARTEEIIANLSIKGLQKSDEGYYGCSAANEHGVVYAETLLTIG